VVKAQEFRLVVLDTLLKTIVSEKKISLVQSVLSWSDDSQFIYTTEYDPSGKTRRYYVNDLSEKDVYDFSTPFFQDAEANKGFYYVDWRKNTLWYQAINDEKQAITNLEYPFKRLRPEKLRLIGDRLFIAQKDVTNTKESLFEYSVGPSQWGKTGDIGTKILPLSTRVFINHISQDGSKVLAVDKNQGFGDIIRVNLEGS